MLLFRQYVPSLVLLSILYYLAASYILNACTNADMHAFQIAQSSRHISLSALNPCPNRLHCNICTRSQTILLLLSLSIYCSTSRFSGDVCKFAYIGPYILYILWTIYDIKQMSTCIFAVLELLMVSLKFCDVVPENACLASIFQSHMQQTLEQIDV